MISAKRALALALLAMPVMAAGLPTTKPEDVGLSTERLQRIEQMIQRRIDAGELCRQESFEILPDETLDAFLRRSKALAADLLVEVLGELESGDIERAPLDLTKGSYYSWPDRAAVRRFHEAGRRLS